MNFGTETFAGASPEIVEAMAEAASGFAAPYGEDRLTRQLEGLVADLFDTDCEVFPVATGTAANALALAAMCPPFGAIYAHAQAHINQSECGAPEFFSGGAKVVGLAGTNGKLHASELEPALAAAGFGNVSKVQPSVVSLSQASEAGTVYGIHEIREIAELAHDYGMSVHMDGARFANALVAQGASPAEATWKAGVDILCLGATKNGALAAEVVVVFDRDLARTLAFRQKRGGHLIARTRFLSAQLVAYLSDDLWLRNAENANRMANRLARGLDELAEAEILHPVEANEVFLRLPEAAINGLSEEGAVFYRWGGEESTTLRLVTSFQTTEDEVDAFLAATRRQLAALPRY